nr:transport and Golgi organization protein 1 homolog [Mirounga angustirostris]
MDKYKQEIGEMQDQLQEAEVTFQHKIAAHERSALDNWIKAQVWERKIVQQRRENAYVKHRCVILTCLFLGVLRGQG